MSKSRVVLFIVLATFIPRDTTAQTVALTHANVVDVETGAIRSNQTIIISGRTIRSTGESVVIPKGARVTDIRNAYVIPGLWDMHAHLGRTGRSSLALYIANGVTGVRDMGSIRGHVRPWKDSVEKGTLLGPRMLLAGPITSFSSSASSLNGTPSQITWA